MKLKLKLVLVFILILVASFAGRSCSTSFGQSVLQKVPRFDIILPEFVPDGRELMSTKWNYIYSFAILNQRPNIASNIADNILRACNANKVDPYIVARKMWKETHAQIIQVSYIQEWHKENGRWVAETNPCAYGLLQVNLKNHMKRIEAYSNGSLRLNCKEDYVAALLRLDVNADIGTEIFRDYMKTFDGRLDLALCAYWSGDNSKEFRQLQNGVGNEYVTWIMDEKLALGEMTMYKFVNRETSQTNSWKYLRIKNESDFDDHGKMITVK